jgi:predicted nucleic acid-binding protein
VTFFVDANVIIYSRRSTQYREPCLRLLSEIASGKLMGRTSTAVIEEVWHVELTGRAGPLDGLTEHAHSLLAPALPVTDEIVGVALALPLHGIGANDRIHVATCLANDIDVIVSADAGFDRVKGIRRVDPLDERAISRL